MSESKRPMPQLADGYSKARGTAITGSALLVLLGVEVIEASKRLPILSFTLPDREIAELRQI